MPSICYVHKDLSTVDRGGICYMLKTLASGMRNMGWKVYALTTKDLSLEGITTIKLPTINNYDDHNKKVSEIIHDLNPDIAECSTWRYELLDFAKSTRNKKTKIVLRCDPPAGSLFENVSELEKNESDLYQLSDARIAISQFAKRELTRKYGVKDVFLVYNGVEEVSIDDLNAISKLSSFEIIDYSKNISKIVYDGNIEDLLDNKLETVFWVGKPTKMKGFDYLEKIVEYGYRYYNFIINIGFSQKDMEWSQENYERAKFIRSIPKNDQLALWRRSKMSISTSRSEGFGIVVSEALSIGLPVVLNSGCETFSEFTPNDAVTLADAADPKTFLDAMKKTKAKVNVSRNPYIFTQKVFVEKSNDIYRKLLRI